MVPSHRSFLGFCLIVIAALSIAGCATTTPPASASAGRSVIAGDTTFIEIPSGQGPPLMYSYTTPGKKPCPECEAVATKYFQTGVLDESVCKTCGAHLVLGQGELLQPK